MAMVAQSYSGSSSGSSGGSRVVGSSSLQTENPISNSPDIQGLSNSYDDGINSLKALPGMITGLYARLKAAGKDSDAWLLRDATERFSNSGRSVGVNAFGRAQALADLQGRMRATANMRELGISQQESGELSRISGELARLGAEKASKIFGSQMDLAKFENDKQNTAWNQMMEFNKQQQAAQAANAATASTIRPAVMTQAAPFTSPRPPAASNNSAMLAQMQAANQKLNANSDMRAGLTAASQGGLMGHTIYDPNYVDRTMGTQQYIQGVRASYG